MHLRLPYHYAKLGHSSETMKKLPRTVATATTQPRSRQDPNEARGNVRTQPRVWGRGSVDAAAIYRGIACGSCQILWIWEYDSSGISDGSPSSSRREVCDTVDERGPQFSECGCGAT